MYFKVNRIKNVNIEGSDFKSQNKLWNTLRKFNVPCPKCKHLIFFYRDENKKLCDYCGIYVYKNEEHKKKNDFESMLKKYLKSTEDIEKGNRNERIRKRK